MGWWHFFYCRFTPPCRRHRPWAAPRTWNKKKTKLFQISCGKLECVWCTFTSSLSWRKRPRRKPGRRSTCAWRRRPEKNNTKQNTFCMIIFGGNGYFWIWEAKRSKRSSKWSHNNAPQNSAAKYVFFLVIPGARLSRAPSLSGPLTHLCDLVEGYRGDGLKSWWGGTGIWTRNLLHASQES